MFEDEIFADWIEKKNYFGSWRKRWLVISPWTCSTYKHDTNEHPPTKVLDLHNVTVEAVHPDTVKLVCSHRTYEFRMAAHVVPRFLKAVEQAQVSPSASTRPLPTATADLARAERTGWAEKKGVMKWNKRWLVLTPFMLSTYKSDEPGIAPTKILDLHSALVSKVDSSTVLIKTPHKAYAFRVASESECSEWLLALQAAMIDPTASPAVAPSVSSSRKPAAVAAGDAELSQPVGEPVIVAGWLQKMGRLGYRKRWVVLTPWRLSTYASEEPDAKPTKVLDLHDVQLVPQGLVLYLHAKKIYQFLMESEAQMAAWKKAISHAMSD